jgi:hypothetical protein
MTTHVYTVKLYGAMAAQVREVHEEANGKTHYHSLLYDNGGISPKEHYCDHTHRSLKAAKRCAASLSWPASH